MKLSLAPLALAAATATAAFIPPPSDATAPTPIPIIPPPIPPPSAPAKYCGLHAIQHEKAAGSDAWLFDLRVSDDPANGKAPGEWRVDDSNPVAVGVPIAPGGNVWNVTFQLEHPLQIRPPPTGMVESESWVSFAYNGHSWTSGAGNCVHGEFEFTDGVKDMKCWFEC